MNAPTHVDAPRETLERVRRIETRLTKLLTHFGLNPGAEKAQYDEPDVVRVPSRKVSLESIIEALPPNYGKEEFDVFIGNDYVCTMFIDR
jgi:hypothetical protein